MTLSEAKGWIWAIVLLVIDCIVDIIFINSIANCLTIVKLIWFSILYVVTLAVGMSWMYIIDRREG